MFTTVKEHMGIVKGLEGLGWQEILGFSNQELLPFTKAIDTDEKSFRLSMERNWWFIRNFFQRS